MNSHTWFCRFEDYVGQLEAATAIAGLSVEKGHTPGIKDRKDIAAIQEVCLHLLGLVVHFGAVWSQVQLVLLYDMVMHSVDLCSASHNGSLGSWLNLICCQGQVDLGLERFFNLNAHALEGVSEFNT